MPKFFLGAVFACAIAMAAFVLGGAVTVAAAGSDTALTGGMTSMQFLVGSWNCSVKIAAMPGQPAATDHGIVTYSVSPGNALHSHVTAKDYAADYYSGYVDKSKTFWMNTIDDYGNVSGETSKDGTVFTGSSMAGSTKTKIRDTFTRPTPSTTRDLQEFQTGGAWHTASDSTCTRA